MSSANASWLGIAMLTFMSTTGCEVLTKVDRDQINSGSGGATTTSSSSSGAPAECTAATVDTDCPDPGNECVTRTCDDGKCGTAPVAQGTPVAAQTTGDCKAAVCDGNGATTTQDDNADVPNDGKECTDDTCANGTPTFTPKATNSACGAGGALYCNATGECVGCTDATQCGQASDCSAPACNNGACGTNFTQPGTPTTNQTMGDCQEEQCNGIGGTKIVTNSSDIVDDNNPCTMDTCNGSTSTHSNLPSGVACTDGGLGKTCNGAGACVECLIGADCTSGVCVAQACAAPTCTDSVKNAVETDVDCGGGVCPTCINGKICNGDTDCTSTVCSPAKTCVASVCGDNRITGAETCDDGGTTAGNGCSATCAIEAGWECAGVPSVCLLSCGDNTLDPGEGCDDGGTMGGNGCSATCTVEAGWECTGVPSTCHLSCGDSTLDAGEGCDDGGTMNGNGCSSTCTIEPGYSCVGEPSVCTASCGDGAITGSEVCDDNNLIDGDGCSASCALETGFTCTGMPSMCTTTCGDGVIGGTENCEDGNADGGDCCSSACQLESGCEIEPNDTTVTANAVSSVFVSNKVKAFIEPNTDTDYFSFTIPAGPNAIVVLESMDGPLGTTCSSLAVDTNVALLDSAGTLVTENDDIAAGNWCSKVLNLSVPPGDYFVKVTNSPFDMTTTFDYTLQAKVLQGCGNGTVDAGEICDDSNNTDGDGCSSICETETGYQCVGTMPSVCTDIDECMLGTADCVPGATCVNTPGGFTCACPVNFGGDGRMSGSGCGTGLYYAFDGSGTTVPNLASTPPLNASNATIVGGQTQGGVGKCGTALNGIGGVSTANHVNTNWLTYLKGSWTISVWTANVPPVGAAAADYLFGDASAASFRCFTGGVAGPNNVLLRGTGLTDVLMNAAANMAPTMATFVYDSSLNDIKGYINGVLTATVVQAAPLDFVGTAPFRVAGFGGNNAFSNGAQMDEFRLYFRALDATEVLNLFTSPTCTP